jgi:spore coat polysaccharide biosynthesis protein SpsF
MHIGAIIQARMSSRRFPGKVLCPVVDKPILLYTIERLKHCNFLDKIIVATSADASDTAIADLCLGQGLDCYRGPLENVAARFKNVLDKFYFDAFVRVCGDSPLLDQRLLNKGIEVFLNGEFDLVTNLMPRTFPSGQSVEIVRSDTFRQAYPLMREEEDLEHVTRFFYRNSSGYRIKNFTADRDYKGIHLAVDTPADFEVLAAILAAMDRPHWEYCLSEIVQLYTRFRKKGCNQ